MKLHEVLQFVAATIPIVAVIWQIAEVKNNLEKQFFIFVSKYEERKEFVDYQLHGLDEKINHKFQRLMDEIQTLKFEIKNLKRNEDND